MYGMKTWGLPLMLLPTYQELTFGRSDGAATSAE